MPGLLQPLIPACTIVSRAHSCKPAKVWLKYPSTARARAQTRQHEARAISNRVQVAGFYRGSQNGPIQHQKHRQQHPGAPGSGYRGKRWHRVRLRTRSGRRGLRCRVALFIQPSTRGPSNISRHLKVKLETDIACRPPQGKAEALAQELRSRYPSQLFLAFQADLASRESTRNLVPSVFANGEIAQKHKAISVLVANAGLGRRIRDPADIGEDDWDEMMEVNSRSQFVVTKACLPGMRAQGWGRVVLVGSIASRGGGINGCHYAATKGALCSMGLNLATFLAPEGVTVNIVLPAMIGATGMIATPKSTTWDSKDDLEDLRATDPGLAIAASVPVHRLGAPEEVANVVTMFVKTGYMTGQELVLGGGLK